MKVTARYLQSFTDRTDINPFISLYDQGCIRNPRTGLTIFFKGYYDGLCIDPMKDAAFRTSKKEVTSQVITLEDLKEVIESIDIDSGYFTFISETKEDVLNNLSNNYLTNYIQALNMYNGYFTD